MNLSKNHVKQPATEFWQFVICFDLSSPYIAKFINCWWLCFVLKYGTHLLFVGWQVRSFIAGWPRHISTVCADETVWAWGAWQPFSKWHRAEAAPVDLSGMGERERRHSRWFQLNPVVLASLWSPKVFSFIVSLFGGWGACKGKERKKRQR